MLRTEPVVRARPLAGAVGALLAVAAVLTAVLVPGDVARAAESPDWTVRTAANDLGTDRSSYSYTVEPGAVVQDGVVVTNRGASPLRLAVYAGNAHTTSDGGLDVAGDGGGATGVGAWVRTGRDGLVLQPGASATVPLTVSVPEDASAGDHVGAVVTAVDDQDGGTDVTRRIGIRMTIRVSGDLVPALRVENARLSWSGGLDLLARGTAVLTYTIRNTGNMVLSVQQTASVAGPFGWLPARARAAAPPRLLPGERWTTTVPVHDVAGLFSLDGKAAVTPVVTDAAGTTSALDPVVVRAHGWAIPWAPLLVVLAVLAAFVVLAAALRRRRTRAVPDVEQPDVDQPDAERPVVEPDAPAPATASGRR
jgi:hypothetical protein